MCETAQPHWNGTKRKRLDFQALPPSFDNNGAPQLNTTGCGLCA
jgi:hypothetical protein